MKINKTNALKLWEMCFGEQSFAEDFHGYLMCKDGYGNKDYYVYENHEKIYCGWNLHHILPKACGGRSVIENLCCTNIATNDIAADKITFWIDDTLYQVKRTDAGYDIFSLN